MIPVPTTIEEFQLLSNRHSDAYWFLQGDLTEEEDKKAYKAISDLEFAMGQITTELMTQLIDFEKDI